MLAVDTNVLVYAHRREPPEHATALELLRSLAAGSEPWAIAWPSVYEFFSVVTNLQRSREMTQVCSRESTQAAVPDRDRDG